MGYRTMKEVINGMVLEDCFVSSTSFDLSLSLSLSYHMYSILLQDVIIMLY